MYFYEKKNSYTVKVEQILIINMAKVWIIKYIFFYSSATNKINETPCFVSVVI